MNGMMSQAEIDAQRASRERAAFLKMLNTGRSTRWLCWWLKDRGLKLPAAEPGRTERQTLIRKIMAEYDKGRR